MDVRTIADCDATIAELQRELFQQKVCLEAVMKDQGLEATVKEGFSALAVAISLNAIRPRYTLSQEEERAIGILRSRLRRPDMKSLEKDVGPGPFDTGPSGQGKPSGAVYQSGAKS